MTRRTSLLGHRGAAARAPENTLASFRAGLEAGADGFELDVRATADGVAVALHDATLDRTTNATGPLASKRARELASIDAGSAFGEAFRGERVPELDAILDDFLGRVTLALEMKERLPDAVLSGVAERADRAEREGLLAAAPLLLASFRPDALEAARALAPRPPRFLILRLAAGLPESAVRHDLGLHGVFARFEDVDREFARDCRDARLSLFVYTVNDPGVAARLAALPVDGIISDDPAAVLGALA